MRVWHLLGDRSLYIDEARLAINIGMRSFVGLAQPLDLEHVAPVLFLWAGMGELSLRLVPFLAGIAMLPIAWSLFRRLTDPFSAMLGLLFVWS